MLLLAAACDRADLATLEPAASHLGIDVGRLTDAEDAGIVTLRDGVVTFGHPLVRSAIYSAASAAERREAHAAVALGLRPQLVGMVLFALTLAILAGRDRWPRLVWLIPLVVVPWANSRMTAVVIRPTREIMMIRLGPTRSSIRPSTSAPSAAVTLATMPKMSTVSVAMP